MIPSWSWSAARWAPIPWAAILPSFRYTESWSANRNTVLNA